METTTQTINYGHSLHFCMYTDEANILVAALMFTLYHRAEAGELTRNELVPAIKEGQARISSYGHTEVDDTEVRAAIAVWVSNRICKKHGWVQLDNYFEDYSG
jgi:hypothetical protein